MKEYIKSQNSWKMYKHLFDELSILSAIYISLEKFLIILHSSDSVGCVITDIIHFEKW